MVVVVVGAVAGGVGGLVGDVVLPRLGPGLWVTRMVGKVLLCIMWVDGNSNIRIFTEPRIVV